MRWAVPMNSCRMAGLVFFSRNCRNGGETACRVSSISEGFGFALNRCSSSRALVSMATGAMMKTVRMMARPFMTMAGGTCCTPRALRTRLVTTTIFT